MAFGQAHASDVLGRVYADAEIGGGRKNDLCFISSFSSPKSSDGQEESGFRSRAFVCRNHSTIAIGVTCRTSAGAIGHIDVFPASATRAARGPTRAARTGRTASIRAARAAHSSGAAIVDGHEDAAHLWITRIRRAHISVQA